MLSDFKDGYIIYFVDLFIKIVFHYFSIEMYEIFLLTSFKLF